MSLVIVIYIYILTLVIFFFQTLFLASFDSGEVTEIKGKRGAVEERSAIITEAAGPIIHPYK